DVPDGFNGAVGQFSLQVTASPTEVTVGDPITVRTIITGRGLIETLTLPTQSHWRDFKVYPPNTAVESNDPLGLSGTKFFTNAVIPLNHEIKALPPLQFTYFDPEARSYRTLTGPAIPLSVRPNAAVAPPPPLPTNAVAAPANPPPVDDLIAIRAR